MSRIDYLRKELYELNSMDAKDFKRLVDTKLRNYLLHHYRNNPFYRDLLREKSGVRSEEHLPKTVEEIGRLPIIDKKWLQKVKIDKNFTKGVEIAGYVETTGSTGKPLRIPRSYSARKRFGEQCIRFMLMGGIDPLGHDTQYWVTHYYPKGDPEYPEGKDICSHEGVAASLEILGHPENIVDESTRTP